MAIAELVMQPDSGASWYIAAAFVSVLIGLFTVFKNSQPKLSEDAPKLGSSKQWPLVGNFDFFSSRWDFHRSEAKSSRSGNWSFFIASWPAVGMSGGASRKLFLESKKLSMDAGYKTLFAGAPGGTEAVTETEHSGPNYFTRRVIQVLRRERLQRIFPILIQDIRQGLDRLAAQDVKVTDPFTSVYDFIYIMIVRVVACNELATDHESRKKLLKNYEMIEKAGTPWVIMFPRLPTWAAIKRFWGGIQVYTTFDKIMKERQRTGRREDDALQILMDDGDDTTKIITFIIGALYAGQLNSGINASWIMVFLAANPQWHKACWQEIQRVVDKHVPNKSLSLPERLATMPFSAWEDDFPIIDACLHETIRLTTPGSLFRRNITDQPIRINEKEVIPPGYFATYAIADAHLDESVYPAPLSWDPSRFINLDGTPAEHYQGGSGSEHNYAYMGWGAGRHPCMGMKFAKLEMNLIVAMWLAYFDFDVERPKGKLPDINLNAYGTERPREPVELRYWKRGEAKPRSA